MKKRNQKYTLHFTDGEASIQGITELAALRKIGEMYGSPLLVIVEYRGLCPSLLVYDSEEESDFDDGSCSLAWLVPETTPQPHP